MIEESYGQFPPDIQELICWLYEDCGMSARQIAKRLIKEGIITKPIGSSEICVVLQCNGVKIRPGGGYNKMDAHGEEAKDISERYINREPVSNIAADYDISTSVIYRILKANNIESKHRKHRKIEKQQDTNTAEALPD